jgi:hypothetical protein
MRVRKRLRRIKRLAYLGVLVGAVFAVRRALTRRSAQPTLGPPATWPPLEPGEPPVAAVGDLVTAAEHTPAEHAPPAQTAAPVPSDEPVAAVGDVASAAGGRAWVEPEDGTCPVSHPVKVNGNSGIYHVPGGQFYARTRPSRCYVDAAAAEADGYRAAKG